MRQAAKNRWFSVQNHLFFIPFFTHKELCELPMKSAFRQNAEAQKFVQQKTTLAAAGQRLYNQTKSRKEGFQVNIKIIQRQCGGTEFLSQPHRLHLGAQNAAGVDELCFTLPEAWAGCTVALYLRRSDGTLLAPGALDTQHCVTADRRLTGSTGGQWMLAAIDASGYAAYTRPGSYDTYAILPTDGGAEELPPSQYEQFVARVLESASTASTAAQRAAASAASTASNAAQAQTAAQRTSADSAAASRCAARAEAAAARAEELVPTDGQVVSVNGKSGVVVLRAQDVGALPRPAQPAAGSLLRVLSVNPDTGALLTDTTPPPDLTPYVRSSTLPDAKPPGPVRIAPQYGVAVREDATLTLVPASAEQLDSMIETLNTTYPDNQFVQQEVSNVTPTIGNEFLAKSVVAVVAACVLILVYVAVRFRRIGGWSAGAMAIVALLHDMFVVYGVFVLLRIPLNGNFIAAMLTILGYSINDTVVIYDRIRENTGLYGKKMSLPELVNLSINQSFGRSMMTSITTCIALAIVCVVSIIFKLDSIFTFAVPLLFGMVSGVYSTMCIATQLWVSYKTRKAAPAPKKA